MNGSKTGVPLKELGYKVVSVVFFREREVARYPTREQAEWRAQELNEWAEKNPRGYIQYLVRPVAENGEDE
jgi:hypothetical protein